MVDARIPRGRTIVAGLLVFAVGFAAGAFALAAIASRASRAYLKSTQLAFANEQDRLRSIAWRAGRIHEAVVHAGCALQAETGGAARSAFDPAARPWAALDYAFLDAMIIRPNEPATRQTAPIREAEARSTLAVTWARLGQAEAADRELAAAAAVSGTLDSSSWRRFGEKTVDLWSQVQEKVAREREVAPAKAP
jgi:hypothetical protein